MGEFADLALLRILAEEAFGSFAVPAVMEVQMLHDGFLRICGTRAITVSFMPSRWNDKYGTLL
jgi:hypothetical protein